MLVQVMQLAMWMAEEHTNMQFNAPLKTREKKSSSEWHSVVIYGIHDVFLAWEIMGKKGLILKALFTDCNVHLLAAKSRDMQKVPLMALVPGKGI